MLAKRALYCVSKSNINNYETSWWKGEGNEHLLTACQVLVPIISIKPILTANVWPRHYHPHFVSEKKPRLWEVKLTLPKLHKWQRWIFNPGVSDPKVCAISVSPPCPSLAIYVERIIMDKLLSHQLPQFPICKMGMMLIANSSGSHMSSCIRRTFTTLRHCDYTVLTLNLNLEVIVVFLLSDLVIQLYISI